MNVEFVKSELAYHLKLGPFETMFDQFYNISEMS